MVQCHPTALLLDPVPLFLAFERTITPPRSDRQEGGVAYDTTLHDRLFRWLRLPHLMCSSTPSRDNDNVGLFAFSDITGMPPPSLLKTNSSVWTFTETGPPAFEAWHRLDSKRPSRCGYKDQAQPRWLLQLD